MFTKYTIVLRLWEEEVIFLSFTELGHTEVKTRNAYWFCAQVELLWMLFLRVLAKKCASLDFTFSCEWSTFVRYRIQGLTFISQKIRDINLMSFWEKHRSVGICLLPCQVSLLVEGWRKLFSNVFRCLTDEFSTPSFHFIYCSPSPSERCVGRIYLALFYFFQGWWIEKGPGISWIMHVIVFKKIRHY